MAVHAQQDKTLLLLRHGKSDWHSSAATDHERPLNERGRTESSEAGAFLSRSELRPDLVLCSTARRTRETWEHVQNAAGWQDVPVQYVDALYLASVATAFDTVAEQVEGVRRLLLVGHQPTLSGFVAHVTGGVVVDIPTATIAILRFQGILRPSSGELAALITPGQFNTTDL